MTPVLLRPGQQLRGERGGVFRIDEWAGEGSYSRVYRGEGPEGPVALKVAKQEVTGAELRLLREREALAQFSHAAIPSFRDSGELAAAGELGTPWLARQWVEGVTLRQRLERDRSLALVQAVPLLLRLSDAVALLHARGWSHGDLRPDNVLLQVGTQHAFLLDLGEARPNKGSGVCSLPVPTAPASAYPGGLPAEWAPGPGRGGQGSGPSRPGPTLTPDPSPLTAVKALAGPPARDLQQLGELLTWCLTGVDPALDPERLSRAAGHHPAAVQLWQEILAGRVPSATAFRDQLRRLARQLGIRSQGAP